MSEDVQIVGGGIAACVCARLLTTAGYHLFVQQTKRPSSPILMLSDQTQLLLHDVFRVDNLFSGTHKITKRTVLWGESAEPVILPHSGLVMPESLLLSRLWPVVDFQSGSCAKSNTWSVISLKRQLPSVSRHEFGSRNASTISVKLSAGISVDSCWVESVSRGWLFLLPYADHRGSLISVGGSPLELLSESRLVAKQISDLGESTGNFAAHPSIVSPLCGSSWIACGTAAIAFDPIAGEGAGNAIREGILASAVIRAAQTEPVADLQAHYTNRLLSGFIRHLHECSQFYSSNPDPWWQNESNQMKDGMSWAQSLLGSAPKTQFRLLDFELRKITDKSPSFV